jgi:hypothetical protein
VLDHLLDLFIGCDFLHCDNHKSFSREVRPGKSGSNQWLCGA